MKILVVCLGNICRSPLAEGILASKLPADFVVDSAGTISLHEGENPDKRAIAIGQNYGIDISAQRSRPIIKQDFQTYDHIYCMDRTVLHDVIELTESEEERARVSLFLEAAGLEINDFEVKDPYWSEMEGFEEAFGILDQASERISKKLTHQI
ncbi:low molecular weight phosphotyrosine protein phosphatase [Marnyiella aurantia]|uniref:protein-tyrosine-phosphatase n=1 Tax=Marnyiella aurantia TaxID=2758037 RepID=A0A7D7LPX5_9FLAO|nr:low molecular weight protein-tyrosine-phosphatase [Marnyiella aurantia]MBA5246180.1 low molecular weight phosphotyrosine protein phosphatase [Marnyiella aurantia]QMS98436.1 low molecular weight phosphotyrosine protein phosphatase [Marnyiella aurantia]